MSVIRPTAMAVIRINGKDVSGTGKMAQFYYKKKRRDTKTLQQFLSSNKSKKDRSERTKNRFASGFMKCSTTMEQASNNLSSFIQKSGSY